MKSNKELKSGQHEFISKDKYIVKTESPVWELSKDIVVSVAWASEMLIPEIRISYLKALSYYAENHSADHTKNINIQFKRFIVFRQDSDISVNSLISYRSCLEDNHEHYLGTLRGFLRKWHELGYPGISDDVIRLLKEWTLKGNVKGRAVSLMDVDKGPLSDIEMSAIIEKLLANYANGKISLSEYALVAIFIHSGRRANQIVNLKIKDVIRENRDGADTVKINFPRSKQRDCGWREQFNTYPITEDLWNVLDLHISRVIDKAQMLLSLKLNKRIIGDLPLFPNYKLMHKKLDINSLNEQLQVDYFHLKRVFCNTVLEKIVNDFNIRSERTGSLLHLTSKRFRYTLGTNLAREGKGEHVIAEALDHSDTQNVGVYVRNIPEIVKHIDKAVACRLAPLAQAFQGVLVDSEKDAIRGDDINSRIRNRNKNVGTCGSYGFCHAMAPIACYTCTYFQPWLDGPHESVLEELIKERDQVLSETKDSKMASVNDRLILAVSDVVLRCKNRKEELYRKELTVG